MSGFRRAISLLLTGAVLVAAPVAVFAQGTGSASVTHPQSPVLTLDWERLYTESLWGKRVAKEIDAASASLRQENNRIAGQLEAEERDLTTQRASMAPADFQKAAEAFDKRATEIRAAQKAKADAIQSQLNAERQAFISAAMPLIDEVLAARGAAVVLDSRVIIRGLASADITAALAQRVDTEIGDGAGRVPATVPASGGTTTGDSAGATGNATNPGDGADAMTAPATDDGVYVDDSANRATETGADPVLQGGAAPTPETPLGLPMPSVPTGDQSGAN
ncbi:OmpH family outer membrane protein [Thioclava pacifica]|uniref:OmpH family outer membrane protein n=1 Tax=Thioclava pacifica TaxID=285109 RepID=UPI000689C382|nr:OmpH family outer membrane protein [Thioclava pacifica]